MTTDEQRIKILFAEVESELYSQLEKIKIDINEQLQVLVPTGSEEELKEFIENQKEYYEQQYSHRFGKPKAVKFNLDTFRRYIEAHEMNDLNKADENSGRRKELIGRATRHFIFGEVVAYLHSLRYMDSNTPFLEEGHHKITILYKDYKRRKDIMLTELDKSESTALYDLLSDINWFLSLKDRHKTNVGTCIGLYSGFSIAEVTKEIDKVTDENKIAIAKKLIKRLQRWLPPEK